MSKPELSQTSLETNQGSLHQRNHIFAARVGQLNEHLDPGSSPGSANQCKLGDVYLRFNLSKEQLFCVYQELFVPRTQKYEPVYGIR